MIHFIFYFNLNSKFEIRTVLTLPHDKTSTISVIQYNNIYVSFILTGGREERAGCYIPSAIVTRQSYSKHGEFDQFLIIQFKLLRATWCFGFITLKLEWPIKVKEYN